LSCKHAHAILRAALLGSLLFALPSQALAQQPTAPPTPQPTLDQILTRVHENFGAYLASVPNLFADEHLVSSFSARDEQSGRAGTNSTIDSVFRLKRTDATDKPIILVESRQIKSVDHRPPAPDQSLTGPVILANAFSAAASFLSPDLERCYDYRLQPDRRLNNATVLVVEYALKPSLPAGTRCPVFEQNTGRVFIDPTSMQIVRLEQKRPHHELTSGAPGSWNEVAPGTLGTWSWSIDYAPVSINNQLFWLPKTISSSTSTNTGRLINWSFVATYSNYHLLTVTSTIVPVVADPSSTPSSPTTPPKN